MSLDGDFTVHDVVSYADTFGDSINSDFLSLIGIICKFLQIQSLLKYNTALEFTTSTFEFFGITSLQRLQCNVFHLYGRQWSRTTTSHRSASTFTQPLLSIGSKSDHVSRSDLIEEELDRHLGTEIPHKFRKVESLFTVEIQIDRISLEICSTSYRLSLGKLRLKRCFPHFEQIG